MSRAEFPIPARLNLAIAAVQVVALSAILWAAGQVHAWGAVALLSLGDKELSRKLDDFRRKQTEAVLKTAPLKL